jgi:SAM-dependent methyltransferase
MGWGYWSRMAQAHGFDVVGFELSKRRSEYARQMGVTVIDALPEDVAGFDCVYANQVFEHLSHPVQTLEALCRQLKPEGIVYLRVPDGRNVAAALEKGGWSPELEAIHPLEHINCFTRKTLTGLASKVGLKPFNPPLRLSWGSLRDGIRRELADRLLTTHLFFRRQ